MYSVVDPLGYLHRWERSDPQFHRALSRTVLGLTVDPRRSGDRYSVDRARGYPGWKARIDGFDAVILFTVSEAPSELTLTAVFYSEASRSL